MRGGTLDHRDLGALLPQGRRDVVGRVVRPDDHSVPALDILFTTRELGGVTLPPGEVVGALETGDVRVAGDTQREDELGGVQDDLLATAVHPHGPRARALVELRAQAPCASPVVEFHDVHVVLEPVPHLVLRREDRPVVGEGQVGHVVIPDRVVQVQRLVAFAPRVTRPLVLLDDNRRHADTSQPRGEPDATLTPADDQHVWLLVETEPGVPLRPGLLPRLASPGDLVGDAELTAGALLLLVPRQFLQCGQQCPATPLHEPQVSPTTPGGGHEVEPCLCVLGRARCGLGELPIVRIDRRQLGLEHRRDLIDAFERLEVPRECHEVTPVAVLGEEFTQRVLVVRTECPVEGGEPHLDGAAGRLRVVTHCGALAGIGCTVVGLSHVTP